MQLARLCSACLSCTSRPARRTGPAARWPTSPRTPEACLAILASACSPGSSPCRTHADGTSLPGFVFDYYFNGNDAGASPGALKSITYASGGIATYSYTMQSLDICDRSFAVLPPAGNEFQALFHAFLRRRLRRDHMVLGIRRRAALHRSIPGWAALGWLTLTNDSVLFSNPSGLNLATLQICCKRRLFRICSLNRGKC